MRDEKQKVPAGATRKELEAQLRRLRQTQGWNPAKLARETPMEAMERLNQKIKSEGIYGEAQACEACELLREDTQDETALCQQHLSEAMGF